MLLNKNNTVFVSIFITLLFFAVIFRYWNHSYVNVIASDGKGYYAYLPAVFIYQDLDFNYFFSGELNIEKDYTSSFLFFIEGHDVIKYPAGVSFLLIPFFLLAMLLSLIAGTPVDGYSFWFQICTSIGAITYTTLGAYWTTQLLKALGITRFAQLVTVAILVFGTNLTIYTIWDPSMSHAYSFGMVSLFLYKTVQISRNYKNSDFLWAAFALATIILIRPVNALIIFTLPAFLPNHRIFLSEATKLIQRPLVLFSGILICSTIIFIQPLLWFHQNGLWYVWTYLGESFDFTQPKMGKILFSFRKGWFIYTPLMLLMIPGLIVMFKKRYFVSAITILLFTLILTYVLSSWWCWYYGGSFGQRSFIDFYPVFAVPVAWLIQYVTQKYLKIALYSILIFLVAVNLIQSYQYKNNIIHYDSMTSEGYWKIFLKTSSRYKWSLFANKNDVADADISNRIIVRYFQDFEYERPFSRYRKADDIADEAMSGNKVIGFHNQTESVFFEIKPDSALQNNIQPKQLRFSAWYCGDLNYISCTIYFINSSDTLFKKEIGPTEFTNEATKKKWTRKQFDVPIPVAIGAESKIVIEFYKLQDVELFMDDAMISIYENR